MADATTAATPTCEYPTSWKGHRPNFCGESATHVTEGKPLCENHALNRFWRNPPVPLFRPPLREATNVADLKQRDRLVRRLRKIRAEAVLDKNTLIHWNRAHPNEPQLDETMVDDIIAWCDGKGPLPVEAWKK